MAIYFTGYQSQSPADDASKRRDRVLVVQAAVELLKAEASAGIAISKIGATADFNKVKQYADWIEEALRVEAESS